MVHGEHVVYDRGGRSVKGLLHRRLWEGQDNGNEEEFGEIAR